MAGRGGVSLPPLRIGVKRATWRVNDEDAASADANFQLERPKVLARDRHCCVYCGFASPSWQEVHHLDDNHANNNRANLVTVCPNCHMVFHIGRAGLHNEAILIWLPCIPQAMVSHLARTVYVAMAIDTAKEPSLLPIRETASSFADTVLMGLVQQAKQRLGTSSPLTLANALIELDSEQYARAVVRLEGIRVWPLGRKTVSDVVRGQRDVFAEMITAYQQQGPYAGLPPATWTNMFAALNRATGLFPEVMS